MRFPTETVLVRTAADVVIQTVISRRQGEAKGILLLLHGLESSIDSGYILSMAQLALGAGYAVCRMNLRTCGGTEQYSKHFYHAGLTADVLCVAEELRLAGWTNLWIAGYSLGANLALKLAGELGGRGVELLAGVVAVSPPIDLEACSQQMARTAWGFYDRRFTRRLKDKYRRFHYLYPDLFPLERLGGIDSVRSFDNQVTAVCFGFGDATTYYRTQSCQRYLADIRVPTLVVQAQDDPIIPFASFGVPALRDNPQITTVFPECGGHVAFLASGTERFWVDGITLEWIRERTVT